MSTMVFPERFDGSQFSPRVCLRYGDCSVRTCECGSDVFELVTPETPPICVYSMTLTPVAYCIECREGRFLRKESRPEQSTSNIHQSCSWPRSRYHWIDRPVSRSGSLVDHQAGCFGSHIRCWCRHLPFSFMMAHVTYDINALLYFLDSSTCCGLPNGYF